MIVRTLLILILSFLFLHSKEKELYEVVVSKLNIRQQPSTKSPKLGYLLKGQKVEVLEQLNNNWAKVRIGNTIGYVYAPYLVKIPLPKIQGSSAGQKLIRHLKNNFFIYLIATFIFLIGAFIVHSQKIAVVFTTFKDIIINSAILSVPVGYGLYYLFYQAERNIAFMDNIHSYILILTTFVGIIAVMIRIAQNNDYDLIKSLLAFILTFPILLAISIIIILIVLFLVALFILIYIGTNSNNKRRIRRVYRRYF